MNQEKIFFITDSACDIPAKDEQELENLCILPIPVTADGKGYYERESFTPEEFYDLIDFLRKHFLPLRTFRQSPFRKNMSRHGKKVIPIWW